ncbi:hypothetical protein V7161_24385 [Neobacillus drentensis]|uniref:hypothetical protein n=1 Tax=Neobacillus drentensis TaxID=220684 RepID=UPI0030030E82
MVGASETFSTKGYFLDEAEGFWKQDTDLFVVKVGKDGRTEWYRPLGSESLHEWGIDIIQTKDGGYIIFGHTHSFASGDEFVRDMYLIKLSSAVNN